MNKSINKIYLVIAVLAVIFSATSCDDIFDQQAGNRVTPELHFKSTVDLQISMAGVIAPLQQGIPKLIVMDGLLSDQMDITFNTDVNFTAVNNHNYAYGNPLLNTSDFYKVIINANEVLANIDRVSEIDPAFDEFYVKQYKNALIGMRSWAYFTLAKLQGEVAYIEDNMTSLPSNGLKYMSKGEIMDTLINQMLPYLHLDVDLVEIIFIGFVNTKALIGEIYLEKNDYQNAAVYLKLGMESLDNDTKFYKLHANKNDTWKDIFVNAEGQIHENICVVPFKSTDGQVNPVTGWSLFNDQYLIKPSRTLMQLFQNQVPLKGDVGDKYRGIGYSVDTINANTPFINKYSIDLGEPYGSDIIVSRAADVHLLLAEALNRLGQHENALHLLNAGFNGASKVPTEFRRWNKGLGVRGRAYLSPITVPEGADAMIYIEDMLIQERAMELAFEGKRYFDLMRIAERRGNPDYLARKVFEKFEDNGQGQRVYDKLMNKENWYVPLNK